MVHSTGPTFPDFGAEPGTGDEDAWVTTSRPLRRTVLRTAAWGTPAVVLASAAPAFAVSGDGGEAPTLARTVRSDSSAELTVQNPGADPVEVVLVFDPVPDEQSENTLAGYSGFEGFTRSSSATSFTLTGTIDAGAVESAFAWWRMPAIGTGTTTVTLRATGFPDQTLTLTLPLS